MKRKALRLIKNDCGKHYSEHGGRCHKCEYFAKLYSRPEIRRGLQYGGNHLTEIFSDRRAA